MSASGAFFVEDMGRASSIAFLLRNADCRSFAVVMSRHKGLGRPVCYHRQQARRLTGRRIFTAPDIS